MSRPPSQSQSSRPLGTQKPAVNSGSAAVPRRSAGTLPGLARTASSLRQHSPLAPSSSSLASLPAHLRNLSAPRIPSPLGKGTPARQTKQSLPVRTSKTTERHVFLPEDPQLAPLPKSPMGSRIELLPPPKSTTRHQPSQSHGGGGGGANVTQDERSEAENMTKREREENRLPRLTAYATAEEYKLKLLQAFLKREHGVGVVRVFDDCVYAVYNLPLLPGYGASTKVRSSPAVKSPGGVSLLERMTMAEDLGYYDSYFPREDPSEATPAEYILSNSPPSPISPVNMMSSLDVIVGHEQDREEEIERVQRRLEDEDGLGDAADLRAEDNVGVRSALEGELRQEEQDGTSLQIELGTHPDPNHPGHMQHTPSTALEPSDLLTPTDQSPISTSPPIDDTSSEETIQYRHDSPPAPAPTAAAATLPRQQQPTLNQPNKSISKRRKSHSTHNQVAEAVFFSYGVSVFFGFGEMEEREIMEDCETAGVWMRGLKEDDWEVEEFHFAYDPEAENPRIYNDMFTFKSHSHLFKLSLSHAIAQSTKLSIYESTMQESLALTSSFPKELSTTGHLQLTRREALKMTGRLFKLRMDVNLIGGILDTPELFWSEASLFPLYEAIHEYLEIGPRVQVLNERLAVAGDLLEIIHEYIEERVTNRITWVVIWLIVVACFVEVGEVVARLIFHAIPRDPGQFMLIKGPQVLVSNVGLIGPSS